MGSTPKSEGGLSKSPSKLIEKDSRFMIIEKELVKDETEISKPHNNYKSQGSKKKQYLNDNLKDIKLLG